jgi:hypothetical protein
MNRGGLLGPDGRPAIGKRRLWLPRDLGLMVESWLDNGATLGDTPRAQGTTPPVLNLSASPGGSLTSTVFPYVQIDGAGARGAATFKVSYDDGATFPHTGIQTAATNTLPGVGAHITANWAAGTYATNNIYEPLAAQVADVTGKGLHAAEATAANRMILRAVGFNGRPCLDSGVASTLGLQTAAFSLGVGFLFIVMQGSASTQQVMLHGPDTSSHTSIWGTTNNSVQATRAAVSSAKNVSVGWLQDGARKTVCLGFDGTHASLKVWVNGAAVSLTDTALISNPGTVAVSGALQIGYRQTKTNGLRGKVAGWVCGARYPTDADVAMLHAYAVKRFPL